jgi:hypothetical protein
MSQCLCCDDRDAGYHYACDRCVNTMRVWLRELEDYAAIIVAMRSTPSAHPTGSIGVAWGSKPPVSLTRLSVMDTRSKSREEVERKSPEFDPTGADEHDFVRSLPNAIHGMAAWIREEYEQPEPTHWTLVSELRFLRAEISRMAIEQWVNELHEDLKELHHHARSLAKDSPPGPLGHCLTLDCKGTVYPTAIKDSAGKHDGGRCDTCQRPYTGPDLVRLGVSEEMAG